MQETGKTQKNSNLFIATKNMIAFKINWKRHKNAKRVILAHLAYIANGKNRVLFCNNSLGGNARR